DLDEGEKEYISENDILTFTMTDIKEKGISAVMRESLEYLQEKTDGIHLSLDVDALDPMETPGTGTPVGGGLSLSETFSAMYQLHYSSYVRSMYLVVVYPLLDDKATSAQNALSIASAFFCK